MREHLYVLAMFNECFYKIIKKGDWPKRHNGVAISVNRLKKLLLFRGREKSNIYKNYKAEKEQQLLSTEQLLAQGGKFNTGNR